MSVEIQQDWNAIWNTYADSAAENPAQEYRRRLIFSELGQPERVLDIGSGQGDFARQLQERFPGTAILGLELSQTGVALSARKVPNADFIQRDLMGDGLVPEKYREWAAAAVCSEMLEHVENPQKVLENVLPFLKKGARVIITVPSGPRSAFDKHIGHLRHFSATELEALGKAAGYQVEKVARAGFPVFNLYKLLVILRGKKLIEDVAQRGGKSSSGLSGLVMTLFGILFKFAVPDTRWGWQLVGVFRK